MAHCCSEVYGFFKKYKGIFTILFFLILLLCVILPFSKTIIQFVLKILKKVEIEKNNFLHILIFISISFFIFSPHPLSTTSLYYVAMGFYFGWRGFFLSILTFFLAALCLWNFAKTIKHFNLEKCCFNPHEFESFDIAFSKKPELMCFGLVWLPFQTQYLLLIPPIFTSVSFSKYLIFTTIGNFTVYIPYLYVGMNAQSLEEAVDGGDIHWQILLVGFTIIFSILITCFLARAMKKMLNEEIEKEENKENSLDSCENEVHNNHRLSVSSKVNENHLFPTQIPNVTSASDVNNLIIDMELQETTVNIRLGNQDIFKDHSIETPLLSQNRINPNLEKQRIFTFYE